MITRVNKQTEQEAGGGGGEGGEGWGWVRRPWGVGGGGGGGGAGRGRRPAATVKRQDIQLEQRISAKSSETVAERSRGAGREHLLTRSGAEPL